MAHYPIKCVRCAHISSNEEVLFDLENTIADMTNVLASRKSAAAMSAASPAKAAAAVKKKKKSIWDDDEEETAAADAAPGSTEQAGSLSSYMTYPDLQKYCEAQGLEPCRPQWQQVRVTPDFADAAGTEKDQNLLIGVSYQKVKGGQFSRATRRLCPVCLCELPSQSGAMPTYNITMMGTSSSGKTVYLCALNYLLSSSQGVLPYRSQLSSVFARGNSDFNSKTSALFNEGILPGTTQIVLTEPLVVQMTFAINNYTKKCLLALSDMRGEDFVAEGGENLLSRGGYFATADGFMLLVSPLNIPKIRRMLPSSGGQNDENVHSALMSSITEYILPFFNDGEIRAPSVVMMSKCDIISKYRDQLQIHASNPVVASEPANRYTHTYFANQDRATREFLAQDIPLRSFLGNTFKSAYFTSFSSLGRASDYIELDDNQNQVVKHPQAIRPIRVIDPIIYLLMRLGFLPEFYQMEATAAAEKRNIEILQRWANTKTLPTT